MTRCFFKQLLASKARNAETFLLLVFFVFCIFAEALSYAQSPTALQPAATASQQYDAQLRAVRELINTYNQFMTPVFRGGAHGNVSMGQRQEAMAIAAGGGLDTMREFMAVLGDVQDSLMSARLNLNRYDEATAVFHLSQNPQRLARAQVLWRRFREHDLELGHSRVQLGEFLMVCAGGVAAFEILVILAQALPYLAVSAGLQAGVVSTVYVAAQNRSGTNNNVAENIPSQAGPATPLSTPANGSALAPAGGVQPPQVATSGSGQLGNSADNSNQIQTRSTSTAPSVVAPGPLPGGGANTNAPAQTVNPLRDEQEQQRRRQLSFNQDLIRNATREAARPRGAATRTYAQLVTMASEELPSWHTNHMPSFDWGRFLIEAEATQAVPLLIQRQFDELQETWRQSLDRARTAAQNISNPIFRVRAAVNSLMVQPLSGPLMENASFYDCLRGRGRNASCETKIIIAALHAIPVAIPEGMRLALQNINGREEPVLWQGPPLTPSTQVIHLQTGIIDSQVRGRIFESAVLDHSFLVQAQRQLPDTRIPVALQDLVLAVEQTQPTPPQQQQIQTETAQLSTAAEASSPASRSGAPQTRTSQQAGSPRQATRVVIGDAEIPSSVRPLPVLNRLIREKLIEWNQRGQMPTGFDWVMLNVEAELARREVSLTQTQFDDLRQRWQQALALARQAADAAGSDSVAKISAARTVLINAFIHNFALESASMITSLFGQGGNCQTSTQLLATTLLSLGIAPPPGEQYVVQNFQDHVQFGTYNPRTNSVWDIITNTNVSPFPGDLFRPELMLHAYLMRYGDGVTPPWPAEPRLLVARSTLPAQEAPDHPELRGDIRNNLGWPTSARQSFVQRGTPLATFGEIVAPNTSTRPPLQSTSSQPRPLNTTDGDGTAPQPLPTPASSSLPGLQTRPVPDYVRPSPPVNITPEQQGVLNAVSVLLAPIIDRAFSSPVPPGTPAHIEREQYRAQNRFRGIIESFLQGLSGYVINSENISLHVNKFFQAMVPLYFEVEPPATDNYVSTRMADRIRELHTMCDTLVYELNRLAASFVIDFRQLSWMPSAMPSMNENFDTTRVADQCSNLRSFQSMRARLREQTILHLTTQTTSHFAFLPDAIRPGFEERFNTMLSTSPQIQQEQAALGIIEDYFAARLRREPHLEEYLRRLSIPPETQAMRVEYDRIRGLVTEQMNSQICESTASAIAQINITRTNTRTQELNRSVFTEDFVNRCKNTFSLGRIRTLVEQRRELIRANPLAAISAMAQTTNAATIVADIGRAAEGLPWATLPLTTTSGIPNLILRGGNPHLRPLIEAMDNPSRVGILSPVRRGRLATTAVAPVSPPPVVTGENVINFEINEIDQIIGPNSQVGAEARTRQTGVANSTVRSQQTPPLHQVRLPILRYIRALWNLNSSTDSNSLISRRWTPQLMTALATIDNAEAAKLRTDLFAHISLMIHLNGGAVVGPGPFAPGISRDFARALYLMRRDEMRQVRSNRTAYRTIPRPTDSFFKPFGATYPICIARTSTGSSACFADMTASNAFLEQLSRELGLPPLLPLDAPLSAY